MQRNAALGKTIIIMKFEILDVCSNRKLVFSEIETDYFTVSVAGDINASLRVYSYCPHRETLSQTFEKLGAYKAPWSGELEWISLEGEFSICFTCNSLGQVIMKAELSNRNTDFELNCCISLEFGKLESIALKAKGYLKGLA